MKFDSMVTAAAVVWIVTMHASADIIGGDVFIPIQDSANGHRSGRGTAGVFSQVFARRDRPLEQSGESG